MEGNAQRKGLTTLQEDTIKWWEIRNSTLTKEIDEIHKMIEEKEKSINKLNSDMQETYEKYLVKKEEECNQTLNQFTTKLKNSYISETQAKLIKEIDTINSNQALLQSQLEEITQMSQEIEVYIAHITAREAALEAEIRDAQAKIEKYHMDKIEYENNLALKTIRDEQNYNLFQALKAKVSKMNAKLKKRRGLLDTFLKERIALEARIAKLQIALEWVNQAIGKAEANKPRKELSFSTSVVASVAPVIRKNVQKAGNIIVMAPIRVVGRKNEPRVFNGRLFNKHKNM